MAPAEDMDDARHKREEAERRERRKAAKSQKSESQREKERKRKEHVAKILGKHGGDKRRKTSDKSAHVKKQDNKSKFQELFTQRAQGFQIDFRFRNAPPRPPVGPCFVGNGLDGVLLDLAQYKPLNAVEVNHAWKLHNEPDLGVPLAPSAMDPRSYTAATQPGNLHPDDDALLNWKGSMGDTAAEELKRRKDRARAAARQLVMGKSPKAFKTKVGSAAGATTATASGKKAFSRVLDETMQSWMKKTTYLSNDYTRKVHDFKSLAKTKQQLAQDLAVREKHFSQRRSGTAIAKTFDEAKATVTKHPTKKHLTPVLQMPFLPNAERWGSAYTHVVMDKSPGDTPLLAEAFVANVEKRDATARMTCQLFVPGAKENENTTNFQGIQQYELDVLPLKEEDAPHVNFCIWVDSESKTASYLPISSRVQLSTGRPLKKKNYSMKISRRTKNDQDQTEIDERLAEIDVQVEERLKGSSSIFNSTKAATANGEEDDDDSDDQGESFVNTTKTIVAEE